MLYIIYKSNAIVLFFLFIKKQHYQTYSADGETDISTIDVVSSRNWARTWNFTPHLSRYRSG